MISPLRAKGKGTPPCRIMALEERGVGSGAEAGSGDVKIGLDRMFTATPQRRRRARAWERCGSCGAEWPKRGIRVGGEREARRWV